MILFLKSFIISVRNNFYFFIEFSLDIFFAITCNNSSLRTEKRQQKIIKDFIVKFLFYDAITSFNFFLPFFIAYFLYICNNPIYIISYWLAARFPKKFVQSASRPIELKVNFFGTLSNRFSEICMEFYVPKETLLINDGEM